MIYKHSKLFIIAMLAMVLTLITPTVASAADVWLITTLRNDSVVDTQRRYGVNIWAGFIPDYWGTPYNQGHYAEGRLRLRYPDEAGQIDAVNFGLITYDPYWAGETGIGWYVRATYAGISCWRGTADPDGQGCYARTDTMLAEDQWHRFIFKINEYGNGYYLQIETEEGTWTVAHFYFDDSQLIYASVGTEFHFDGPNILNDYPAGFSFHHPVYHVYSSGGWTDWAASSGSNVNYFQHWYGNCTNPFRGHMPYQSDWRYWYAGTGASTGSNDRCFANPQF